MTDLEQQLVDHLRREADAVEPRYDLESIEMGVASALHVPPDHRLRRRTAIVLAAAAVVAGAVVLPAVVRTSTSKPSADVGPEGLVVMAANQLWGGRNGDLYVLTPGQPPRMIVGAMGDGVAQQCPQLSPDARFLAWGEATASGVVDTYRGQWPVRDRAVVVARIAGDGTVSKPTVRVSIPDGDGQMVCPRWSPDGSAIAYRVDGGVWRTDLAEGGTTDANTTDFPADPVPGSLEAPPAEVAWSNDGSRLAVNEPGRIRIIDVASGATSTLAVAGSVPRHLAWLPGDQQLLFAPMDESGNLTDIVAVAADGSGPARSVLGSLPSPGVSQVRALSAPVLSPDGSRIALRSSMTTCDSATSTCSDGSPEILVIDLATSAVTRLQPVESQVMTPMQWSPDGRRLLLSSIEGVSSVPVDGQGPTVTLAEGSDLDLEWFNDEISWQR